jgi:hypothetical protein
MTAHRKCSHNGPRFPSNRACIECQTARRKARRQKNPEAVNAYNRKRRAENSERESSYGRKYRKGEVFAAWYARNRPRELWKKAKQRAEKSGRSFTITIQDVENLIADSNACPYTKVPYTYVRGRNPWAASLDRKDSTKGYTPDNIEITSLWWNLAKNSWAPDIMETALHGLRSC